MSRRASLTTTRCSDYRRGCLICATEITLPDGRVMPATLSVPLCPVIPGQTLSAKVRAHLERYQSLACVAFGGACKVRIIQPCSMAQECG